MSAQAADKRLSRASPRSPVNSNTRPVATPPTPRLSSTAPVASYGTLKSHLARLIRTPETRNYHNLQLPRKANWLVVRLPSSRRATTTSKQRPGRDWPRLDIFLKRNGLRLAVPVPINSNGMYCIPLRRDLRISVTPRYEMDSNQSMPLDSVNKPALGLSFLLPTKPPLRSACFTCWASPWTAFARSTDTTPRFAR